MIRSILHLKPAPGRSRALLEYIVEQGIISRALSLEGCLSAEVETKIPDAEDVVVTALWTSIEAYEAWLQSPARLRSGAGMLPLLDADGHEVSGAWLYQIEQAHGFANISHAAATAREPAKTAGEVKQ